MDVVVDAFSSSSVFSLPPSLHAHIPSILSFVFFFFLFNVVSPLIFSHTHSYSRLTAPLRVEWDSRLVSTVHAVVVTSVAAVCVALETEAPLRCTTACHSCRWACAVACGYLAVDLAMMLRHWRHLGDGPFLLHHVLAFLAFHFVVTQGSFVWFANFRLLAEASTPFVNQRWFLDVSGLRASRGYFINGLLLTASFFAARIAAMPFYYASLWTTISAWAASPAPVEDEPVPGTWPAMGLAIPVLLDVLNLFWFWKLVRGVKKILAAEKERRLKRHEG